MHGRRVSRWIGLAAIAAGAVFLAAGLPGLAQRSPVDLALIAAALAFAAVQGRLRAPAAIFERSPHPQPKAERVALLLPLLLWLFAVEGWWAAAAANVVAQLVPPLIAGRRIAFIDRLGAAAVRVVTWFALAHVAAAINERGPLAFIGLNIAWYLAANVALLDPLTSLRTGRRVWYLWRARLRDPISLAQLLGEVSWAWIAVSVARTGGAPLGLAVLLPLVVIAAMSLHLARTQARLHRVTLTRAAVEAMLAATDPLPQIRSLLGSVDARLVRESLEVFAYEAPRRTWTRIARLGTVAPTALRSLGTTALDALTLLDDAQTTQRSVAGAAYAVPIRDDDALVGGIVVYRTPEANAVLPHAELGRAAAELGPVLGDWATIEATRSAAAFDALTGLANRRTVGRAVDEAMAYVRDGGAYAVLLLDLDHFKSINDLLGHQEGDRVLAAIGRIIAENVREGDLAGRFGGEEFIVLLRDASRERALTIAERLRGAVAAGGLLYADGAPLTVSVGVAYVRAGELSRDVIERADRALYRAKNDGRNRVVESPVVA